MRRVFRRKRERANQTGWKQRRKADGRTDRQTGRQAAAAQGTIDSARNPQGRGLWPWPFPLTIYSGCCCCCYFPPPLPCPPLFSLSLSLSLSLISLFLSVHFALTRGGCSTLCSRCTFDQMLLNYKNVIVPYIVSIQTMEKNVCEFTKF